jgi:hypothetical protein
MSRNPSTYRRSKAEARRNPVRAPLGAVCRIIEWLRRGMARNPLLAVPICAHGVARCDVVSGCPCAHGIRSESLRSERGRIGRDGGSGRCQVSGLASIAYRDPVPDCGNAACSTAAIFPFVWARTNA